MNLIDLMSAFQHNKPRTSALAVRLLTSWEVSPSFIDAIVGSYDFKRHVFVSTHMFHKGDKAKPSSYTIKSDWRG